MRDSPEEQKISTDNHQKADHSTRLRSVRPNQSPVEQSSTENWQWFSWDARQVIRRICRRIRCIGANRERDCFNSSKWPNTHPARPLSPWKSSGAESLNVLSAKADSGISLGPTFAPKESEAEH
jgi:hypothetical protein